MPVSTWKNIFNPSENGTVVLIIAQYPKTESLEFVLKMGMEEGLSMAQDNLDEVLKSLTRQSKFNNHGQ